MRKLTALLLLSALLLSLAGCAEPGPVQPGQFYYLRATPQFSGEEAMIVPETRELLGMQDDLDKILQAYLQGPLSDTMQSPFPRDTTIVEWKMIHSSLHLNFSKQLAQLSGVDLSLACACVAKTCMELTDAQTVRIRADGALLNGSTYIVMHKSNLLLADDSLDQLRTELTLYYTDSQRRYLLVHTQAVNLADQEDIASYLVGQLLNPPEAKGLVSPLPEGTRLLSCRISDGLCTLDLSQEFEQNAFSQSFAQRTTLLSLVNTLTQLEDVQRVEFYLEGSLMARYQELTLSNALVFDESAIGPVRTGMNEYDATLYVSNGSALYLAAVPLRIRAVAGISQAEQVVQQLLDYRNPNGFQSTIPAGTRLRSLEITDGLCTIDLSGAFLSDTEQLPLRVHAIVASVCALDGIDQVLLTVEGSSPKGEYGALFVPLAPSSDWFL